MVAYGHISEMSSTVEHQNPGQNVIYQLMDKKRAAVTAIKIWL